MTIITKTNTQNSAIAPYVQMPGESRSLYVAVAAGRGLSTGSDGRVGSTCGMSPACQPGNVVRAVAARIAP